MSDMDWAEAHGYTQKCRGCGQTTDSTYCSTRCELDDLARSRADSDEEDEDPEPEQEDEDRGRDEDDPYPDRVMTDASGKPHYEP